MSLSLEQASYGSFALTKAGVATGSTTSQIAIVNSVTYVIDGIYQTAKGAVASIPIVVAPGASALATLPIGFKCAFGIWLDAAGTVTVTQGVQSPYAAVTDAVGPPQVVANRCCIGVFTVAATTAAFVPTVTLLGTGNTVLYKDVFALPGGSIS